MKTPDSYPVTLQQSAPRTIAAVRARMTPDRVPLEFRRSLDQVYAARAGGLRLDGQNVFLYRDAEDQPGQVDADFGVGTTAPVAAVGAVRPVELPVGEVATTTHRGSYAGLPAAHEAVLAWCRANSRQPAGPRWEVYGHWVEGEVPRTDVFYLLKPAERAR